MSHAPLNPPKLHGPSLAVALLIMLIGTVYPPLMANPAGQADHRLTMALLWAMTAGFVRGVGFVPQRALWRWLFSGWAVLLALFGAAAFKLGQ